MDANQLYSELSKVVRAEVYKQIDQPMTWQVANAVTANVTDAVIGYLDKSESKEEHKLTVWYMRDNHTFLKLSNDVEEAIEQLNKELEDNWVYGILAARSDHVEEPPSSDSVQARGSRYWDLFIDQVREYYAKYITKDN